MTTVPSFALKGVVAGDAVTLESHRATADVTVSSRVEQLRTPLAAATPATRSRKALAIGLAAIGGFLVFTMGRDLPTTRATRRWSSTPRARTCAA
ncbi:hypothetical protein [Streptomyces sp. NPDC013489]|uniref:hypothetical protein n=1 Tax=Streptomyces sp. NPDC013489 TaxID=3155606 RepID=UPI0033C09DD3